MELRDRVLEQDQEHGRVAPEDDLVVHVADGDGADPAVGSLVAEAWARASSVM